MITQANRDRGKTQVLVASYDLETYLAAFRDGAFFAVIEDNAVKAAYPTVTNIDVGFDHISISTAAQSDTVTWVGNGQVIAEGSMLTLSGLPDDLVYVRAEINDGDGRTVFTQPFSLGPAAPPPPGEPIPVLPGELGAILEIALLALAIAKAPRAAQRA